MQVDQGTITRYEKDAPELLESVTSGEAENIMKRNPKTGYCVRFDDGLCSIHRERGDAFLGDACHFFPRITRRIGEEVIMSASISCPEIVRIILNSDAPFKVENRSIDRQPYTLKNYLPEGLEEGHGQEIISALMDMVEEAPNAERAMARIVIIAKSLETFEPEKWHEVVPFLIKMADSRLLPPQKNQNDPYFLLQTLWALIHASGNTKRPRMEEVFERMEKALGMIIDRSSLDIMLNVGQEDYPQILSKKWDISAREESDKILKRWMQAQLSMAGFPFAGFGKTLYDRAVIMAVRFATTKLALMCHMQEDGNRAEDAAVVKIIQTISRFMDHLADPELSINLYTDAGWMHDARLRALVGDS